MSKKGQFGVGLLIMAFVGIIVGAIIIQSAAQNVGTVTNTVTLANISFTSASVGGSVYLTNYKSISNVVIYNATGTLVPAGNYTITNNVIYNGNEAVKVTTGAVNAYAGQVWNISGIAQPLTYANDSASRTILGLVVIFGALAVAAIALIPVAREGITDIFG